MNCLDFPRVRGNGQITIENGEKVSLARLQYKMASLQRKITKKIRSHSSNNATTPASPSPLSFHQLQWAILLALFPASAISCLIIGQDTNGFNRDTLADCSLGQGRPSNHCMGRTDSRRTISLIAALTRVTERRYTLRLEHKKSFCHIGKKRT